MTLNFDPYISNPVYEVCEYTDREQWKAGRKKGIGGSDAASALGMSKWHTNVDLWKIKTGRKQPEDISNNPAVIYGTYAEEHLRNLYKLETEDRYSFFYKPDTILVNKKNDYMRYSPDGLLIEKDSNRLGIWECKTAHANRYQKELWKTEIPREYYIQILHGMNVLGAEFVELHAQINHGDWFERRTFHIERDDVTEDLEFEKAGIEKFMKYIEDDVEPPLWIY